MQDMTPSPKTEGAEDGFSLADTPAGPSTGESRNDLGDSPTSPEAPTMPEENSWAPGFGAYPPAPPFGSQIPAMGQPQRPRGRRGMAALLAIIVLVSLAVGAGGGVALDRAIASSGSGQPASNATLGSTSTPAVNVSASTTSVQQDLVRVAKAVAPSVVKITSVGTGGQGAEGSGDILTSDGYIVTNDHVVQGFSTYTVTLSNGTSYPARIVGQDPQDDLAVVKINATNLKPIAVADSSKVQVGEFAIAVGNALGLPESQTLGVVSALNQTASEAPSGPASELIGLIQTSAPINPGNSGGALVNLQGQLIGIPTLEATNPETGTAANGIGYAIASNRVQYVAQQLIKHGQLTTTGQGFLGIQAQDVTPRIAAADGLSAQSGVLVAGFANDAAGASPAQQAGLQTGDVITAVNGHTVASGSDLAGILLNDKPGTKVSLTVVRGTSHLTITATLGERPISTQG